MSNIRSHAPTLVNKLSQPIPLFSLLPPFILKVTAPGLRWATPLVSRFDNENLAHIIDHLEDVR